MTTFPIALSALLLLTPSGAFLLDQHRPRSSLLVSSSRPADGTPSALSVKEDVSDAETIETTKTDLDVSSFLNDMEEEIESISTLKEAAGIGTLLPDDNTKGDIYTRAIAKMEAMAQGSIDQHKADMEDFNNEIDIATKNELDAKARQNGPIIAFSFLALAIGGGMVATAPEAIYGIDLNNAIGGLPTIDLPSLNIDLPMPQIDLSGIDIDIDVSTLQQKISDTKNSLFAQTDSFSSSFPTIVSEMTSQVKEVAGPISNQVQDSLESMVSQAKLFGDNIFAQIDEVRDVVLPAAQSSVVAQADALRANIPSMDVINEVLSQAEDVAGSISNQVQGSIETISENIIAQTNEVRDVVLPAAQSAIVAQVAALQDNVPSVGEIQNTASAYSRNVQYFVGPMVDGQVEHIRNSLNDAQLYIASYSDDVLREMATFQNVALDKVDEMQEASINQAQALQNTIEAKASSIDVDSIVAQAQMGTDAVMKQAASSFAEVSELIQTTISDADTYANAVTTEATVAIQSFEVPSVDVTPFVDRAKSMQEAISLQISHIEFPTAVDISSLNEGANKVAKDKIAEIEPILQQNLGIPL